MNYLDLDKIQVKQTKVTATVSINLNGNSGKDDSYKRLVAIALMSGASGNTLRQLSNVKFTNSVDFDKIKEFQKRADNLIYDVMKEIDRIEDQDGLSLETHNFQ